MFLGVGEDMLEVEVKNLSSSRLRMFDSLIPRFR